MNISLRKANAVQNSVQEALRSIKMESSIEINEFQNAEEEIVKANTKLFALDARRQRLLLAFYNIRGLVGAANAQSGIDVNLTKAAYIDKRLAQLQELADLKQHTAMDVIKGQLEKIRSRPDDTRASIYGRSDTVTTTVVAQEQIEAAKAEIQNLKKQKQKLNDETLELNIRTEVPLSDEVVATLTAEGLI